MKVKLRRHTAPELSTQVSPPAASNPLSSVTSLRDLPDEELALLRHELEQHIWKTDPNEFMTERCKEFVWSKQRQIAQSVCDNRQTGVPSCHGAGKSFIASRIAAWWLTAFPPGEAFVVSSAPTGRQVRAILWREIGRIRAKANLPGRTNQTEWMMAMPWGNEEIVGFGMKPDDLSPTAFQGIHARRVLVIFDEATGIAPALWDAADTLLSNDESRMLAIGNPDDPDCEFAKVCKPGSGWTIIRISAFDTPNFTGEEIPSGLKKDLVGPLWVESKRKKWAPQWYWNETHTECLPPNGQPPEECSHPFWQSKVLGLFPVIAGDGALIPISWILKAQQRTIPEPATDQPAWKRTLGVDVGGGGDSSTVGFLNGPRFKVVMEDHNPDTMITCGKVVGMYRETRADQVNVDSIGIGHGIADRGKELQLPFHSVNVSMKPIPTQHKRDKRDDNQEDELFLNLRAQLWWSVRTLFETGTISIDPLDDDLASELTTVRYFRTSAGKVQIESKEQAKKRGVGSPNRAESLMLATAPIVVEFKEIKVHDAVWG